MSLKLYGMPVSTNTLRVIATLNEKGLDYELVSVDITSSAQKKTDFLALNPFGHIPVLTDGDLTLFESRAITMYIAKQHAGTGTDLLQCGVAVGVWLEVESQEFNPPIASLVLETVIKPVLGGATDPAVVEAEAAKLGRVLDVYEVRLSQSKYLAGGEFSLADLHHLPCIYYLMRTPKADLVTSRPNVRAWWETISSRPAWKKAAAGIYI